MDRQTVFWALPQHRIPRLPYPTSYLVVGEVNLGEGLGEVLAVERVKEQQQRRAREAGPARLEDVLALRRLRVRERDWVAAWLDRGDVVVLRTNTITQTDTHPTNQALTRT